MQKYEQYREKISAAIKILLCVSILTVLAGCDKGGTEMEDIIDGGVVNNTNYLAPKEIESEDLVSFQTHFFRWADRLYGTSRSYSFSMTKSADGTYTIREDSQEPLNCETDAAFAAKLQQLIREYELISLNGTDEWTNGLPGEYSPCSLSAEYVSGEELSFYMDGDPEAEWSGAVLDLFAAEFGAHGIKDLLPQK